MSTVTFFTFNTWTSLHVSAFVFTSVREWHTKDCMFYHYVFRWKPLIFLPNQHSRHSSSPCVKTRIWLETKGFSEEVWFSTSSLPLFKLSLIQLSDNKWRKKWHTGLFEMPLIVFVLIYVIWHKLQWIVIDATVHQEDMTPTQMYFSNQMGY